MGQESTPRKKKASRPPPRTVIDDLDKLLEICEAAQEIEDTVHELYIRLTQLTLVLDKSVNSLLAGQDWINHSLAAATCSWCSWGPRLLPLQGKKAREKSLNMLRSFRKKRELTFSQWFGWPLGPRGGLGCPSGPVVLYPSGPLVLCAFWRARKARPSGHHVLHTNCQSLGENSLRSCVPKMFRHDQKTQWRNQIMVSGIKDFSVRFPANASQFLKKHPVVDSNKRWYRIPNNRKKDGIYADISYRITNQLEHLSFSEKNSVEQQTRSADNFKKTIQLISREFKIPEQCKFSNNLVSDRRRMNQFQKNDSCRYHGVLSRALGVIVSFLCQFSILKTSTFLATMGKTFPLQAWN